MAVARTRHTVFRDLKPAPWSPLLPWLPREMMRSRRNPMDHQVPRMDPLAAMMFFALNLHGAGLKPAV